MTSASATLLRNALCALSLASAPLLASPAAAHDGSGDSLSYVYYADGSGSSMGSGETSDWQSAQALRAGDAPFLYVRDDSGAYVIRDAAILARVKEIMAPQQELGRRQGALGKQQGELGRRQGAMGAEQGRIGRQMADARAREMSELGRQQAALGSKQSELGVQQAALGAQQAELGRQQAEAARIAQPKFRALVSDALRRGLAQRVQ
jgi:hypothetical protein